MSSTQAQIYTILALFHKIGAEPELFSRKPKAPRVRLPTGPKRGAFGLRLNKSGAVP